ncbi:unnamed protein product [Trichogramma brassicae]|uniref:Uncharacterized protein n=1 Tax=Trichogramma brassicae TaxID=86971 RepID=A0A6H5J070_9HYME|nr:unnamed protein product [Trichogramma brassicae]
MIDLVLEGTGQYIDLNLDVCDNQLDQYYARSDNQTNGIQVYDKTPELNLKSVLGAINDLWISRRDRRHANASKPITAIARKMNFDKRNALKGGYSFKMILPASAKSLGVLGRIAALVLPINPLTLPYALSSSSTIPLVYQKNHWTMCRPAGDTRRARLALPIQLAKFLAARARRCGFVDSALRARLAVLPLFLTYKPTYLRRDAAAAAAVAVEAATRLCVLRATSQTGSSSGAVRSELHAQGARDVLLILLSKKS